MSVTHLGSVRSDRDLHALRDRLLGAEGSQARSADVGAGTGSGASPSGGAAAPPDPWSRPAEPGGFTGSGGAPAGSSGLAPEKSLVDVGTKCRSHPHRDLHQPPEDQRAASNRGKLPAYVERCGSSSYLVAWKTKDRGVVHEARRLFCRSWRCTSCAKHLSRRWFCKLREVPSVTHGITLTFDRAAEVLEGRTPEMVERDLYGRFQCLVKRARRAFGAFEYFVAAEWHRSGWPHLHVLVRDGPHLSPEVFKRWLDVHGVASGFGRVSWVTAIYNSEGAASYVLSDVTKTYQLRKDYSKGFRRIRCSRRFFAGVEQEEKPEVLAYEFLKDQKLETVVDELKRSSVPIVSEESREVFDAVGEIAAMSLASVEYRPPPGSRWNLIDKPRGGLWSHVDPARVAEIRRAHAQAVPRLQHERRSLFGPGPVYDAATAARLEAETREHDHRLDR